MTTNAKTQPRIIIDIREPQEMLHLLQDAASKSPEPVEVQVEQLECGDYQLPNDWIVTRKSFDDFVSSLYSGHLHDEIINILLYAPNGYFLVIETPYQRIKDKKLLEAINKINICYCPVVFTNSVSETAELLIQYALKIVHGDMEKMIRQRPVIQRLGSKVIEHYASIPYVGNVRAAAIYKKYSRPADFYKEVMNNREWYKELGIGQTTAMKIEAFILDGVVVEREIDYRRRSGP